MSSSEPDQQSIGSAEKRKSSLTETEVESTPAAKRFCRKIEVDTTVMASVSDVPCPICEQHFPLATINQHIDSCLTCVDKICNVKASEAEDHQLQIENKYKQTNLFGGKSRKMMVEKNENCHAAATNPQTQTNNLSFKRKDSIEEKNSPPMPVVNTMKTDNSFFMKKSSTISNRCVKDQVTISENKADPAVNILPQTCPVMRSGMNMLQANLQPLAEIMRPNNLEQYIGQTEIIGPNKQLQALLSSGEYLSMILWGPPGSGKTTLAKIIAARAKSDGLRFVTMSATTSGVADIKEVTKAAKNDLKIFKRRTLLFVDEIHHFNKTQQDTFLSFVEDGTIILIGATTENPSFQLNNALLSRCRLVVLEKHSSQTIRRILERALKHLNVAVITESSKGPVNSTSSPHLEIEEAAVEQLALFCDGDARAALNCLEMALRAAKSEETITARAVLEETLQRKHVNYDRAGEEHYNCASALQKSIRGGSDQGAIYWVARMMEGGEDPLYIARRLVRTASEDIGLADPMALTHAMAAFQACHALGKKESDVILAQLAVYLARAPKSIEVYSAYNAAVSSIRQHQGPLPGVPLHLRNASTRLMKELGYGKGYIRYGARPDEQTYLPEGMANVNFFANTT